MTAATLKGMTWDHPRGYLPLVAASSAFEAQRGIAIEWDRQPLRALGSKSIQERAESYDLLVIEHSDVGEVAVDGSLAPLDLPEREQERTALADGGIAQSYAGYEWHGRQWAFPIDAMTHVQAWRPDRMLRPLATWKDVMSLARAKRLALPLRPPFNLWVFYTLCGNLGFPCSVAGPDLIDLETGIAVLEMLRELVSLLDPRCFQMDPVSVYEAMAASGSPVDCAPLICSFSGYSVPGFRKARIAFADIPVAGAGGPIGAVQCGFGIAVSGFSSKVKAATDFAYFVARGDVQADIYAPAGGQPAHVQAWNSERANRLTFNFYRDTRATIDRSLIRPRHKGAIAFEADAASALVYALNQNTPARPIIEALNRRYAASFAG